MKQLLKRYNTLFDELNKLTKKLMQSETAVDDFMDFLIEAYEEGFIGAEYMLGEEYELNSEKLYAALNKSYDGESIYEKLLAYIADGDTNALQKLLESETHRVYLVGTLDGADLSTGNIQKKWVTVGDEKVRDTHAYLQGKTAALKEKFVTNDGDSALAPGLFAKAQNNVNCRCVIQLSKA